MSVVWVRWQKPGEPERKARIENCDDEKVSNINERCYVEFAAPITAQEQERRDRVYNEIMQARRTGSRRFALPPS